MRAIVATIVVLTFLGTGAGAATLAFWNFNDQDLIVDQGSGSMSLVGVSYNWETDPGKLDPNDPTGASIEIYGWPSQTGANKTHGLEFAVPTTGQSNIKVRWDLRHNIKNGESGPNTALFQYSVDGGSTWIDGPIWTDSGDQWYLNREVDLSNVSSVNDNPNFKFRIVAAWEPAKGKYMPCAGSAYGASRKWRMDLIKVHNDTAPDSDATVALWDFNDQRDLKADYCVTSSSARLIGGVVLDGDGYSDDFAHDDEPWDITSSSDPSLKGKALDTTGYPDQGTNNLSAGIECRVSTIGCSGIKISFDLKHKTDSSRYVRLQYTTNINANPVQWHDADPLFGHEISDPLSQAWWFNHNVVDLSSITQVNNNPNFAFRIVTAFDPFGVGYAASLPTRSYNQDPYMNKLRFDMIRVSAQNCSATFGQCSLVSAKRWPEWSLVSLDRAVVSAIHPDYFWIEDVDRTAGIKVYAPQHNVSVGWQVDVDGVTRLARDKEKYVYARDVAIGSYEPVLLKPFHLTNGCVGGGDWFYSSSDNSGQPGVSGGLGLNNIGLLVKVTGRVTAVMYEKDDYPHIEFLYIDDGTGLLDGTMINPDNTRFDRGDDPELAQPVVGLRIVTTKNFSGDYLGKLVEVVGISSLDRINSIQQDCVRAIRRPVVRVLE